MTRRQLEREASRIWGRKMGISKGAYVGTTDDRYDRWYIEDLESSVVDRRGSGYATLADVSDALDIYETILITD